MARARDFRSLGVGAFVSLAVGASALLKVHDPDVWWEVKTGQWIWAHGAVPTHDPFSFTAPGPWKYTEALTELLFAGAHRLAGVAGLGVLQGVLAAGLAGLVYALARGPARTRVRPGAAALAVALFGVACRFRFGPKADLFTFAGFALTLLVVRHAESEKKPRRLLWLLPALALWSNLHRGGTIALAVLGVALPLWAFRRQWPLARFAAIAFVLAPLALALNSGGAHYVLDAFDLASRASFARELPEWAPMKPSFLQLAPAFAAVTVVWLVELALERRADVATLCVPIAFGLALHSVRFEPIAVVAMTPGVARAFDRAAGRVLRRLPSLRPALHEPALAGLAVVLVAAQFVLDVPASLWGVGVLRWRVPVAVGEFLRAHPPPGRMWNAFNYGGYLLYALAPRIKVFIDGRNDTVYPDRFFAETTAAVRDPRVMRRQLERYHIGFAVIAATGLEEHRYLGVLDQPNWKLVYMDDLAAVLVRDTPKAHSYIARFGYRVLRPNTAISRAAHIATDPEGAELAREILRNAHAHPDSIRAQVLLALLARARGAPAAFARARQRAEQLAAARGVRLELR